MRAFDGRRNTPDNFEFQYNCDENYSVEENHDRLIEATNNIAPVGRRFMTTESQLDCIRKSVDRAISFLHSEEYVALNSDLNDRVFSDGSETAIAHL